MENEAPPTNAATAMEPTPAPAIDMDQLALFNPKLASRALAQLYADGRKELALAWASKLDPFCSAEIVARDCCAPPATSYGSLLDIAMRSGDLDFVDSMCEDPALRAAIYRQRCDYMASMGASRAKEDPQFAERILARLDPEPHEPSARQAHDGIVSLAKAACAGKHYDWLARLDALRRTAAQASLPGPALAAECFRSPPDAQGVRALLDLDALGGERERYRELASLFVPIGDPASRQLGLDLLGRFHGMLLAHHKVDEGSDRYSQTVASSAFSRRIHETPLPWLSFFLERGFDPFAIPPDGSSPAAADMLGHDWRDEVRGLSGEQARAAKRAREDALAPLLAAMLAAAPDHVDAHFDLGAAGPFAKRAFRGIRKIDCLALCVAQGYYRLAGMLLDAGADWKFASQQCSAMRPQPHDEPDAQAQAKAYLEAASLRAVSEKSSARRDAKAIKATGAAPAPAARPFRL